MVNASQVEELNARIEKLNVQRTKAEARQEVLKNQLASAIEDYKKLFGVDLSGRSFDEIKAKVSAEVKKVSAEVEKEYALKEKVVSAIESGDYETAYNLLGIEKKSTETVAEQHVVKTQAQKNVIAEDEFGVVGDNEGNMDLDLDMGDDEDSTPEVVEEKPVEVEKPKKKVELKGTGALDALQDMGTGDLEVGDDDVPNLGDDDLFGFGDLLSGTKFNPNGGEE